MPIVVLGLDVLSSVYGAPGKCQAGSGQALTTHAHEELTDLSPSRTERCSGSHSAASLPPAEPDAAFCQRCDLGEVTDLLCASFSKSVKRG